MKQFFGVQIKGTNRPMKNTELLGSNLISSCLVCSDSLRGRAFLCTFYGLSKHPRSLALSRISARPFQAGQLKSESVLPLQVDDESSE